MAAGSIDSADALRQAILLRYDALSPRLQQIARFILDDPHSAGVETLATIAQRCDSQPSTIVRFAKSFGFDGAAAMQRVLKDDLLASRPASAYNERVRQFTRESEDPLPGTAAVFVHFARAAILSLEHGRESFDATAFDDAVARLARARIIYVAGVRRSFPAAAYLAYSLQQVGKVVILLDGSGGTARQQVALATDQDLIVAISFNPFAEETIQIVEVARANNAAILALTDSVVSSIAKMADSVLLIRETQVRGFRTLTATMLMVQSLAVATAYLGQELFEA